VSRFFALDDAGYQQFRTRYGYTAVDASGAPHFVRLPRNSGRNPSLYDINVRARRGFVIGRTAAALFIEVFNLLNTDDLRILTYQPARSDRYSVAPVSAADNAPLQIDATRRFGRRFQFGLQIQF